MSDPPLGGRMAGFGTNHYSDGEEWDMDSTKKETERLADQFWLRSNS